MKNPKQTKKEFEKLLQACKECIDRRILNNQYSVQNLSAIEFEKYTFNVLETVAKGTPFEGTIKLISGHKFPDIVVGDSFGVEVKTTKSDSWKSTGNSVLESTRIESVDYIYIFFGKLTKDTKVKYREYSECLSDIAVTHSPRYIIDMELPDENSICQEMGISYEKLRKLDNPVKPFVNYYKKHRAKPGEEPWWMGDGSDYVFDPVVKIFSDQSKEMQNLLIAKAFILFPEVLGKGSKSKYSKVASWLASRFGLVDRSVRDRFSAGGKVDEVEIGSVVFEDVPRVLFNLCQKIDEVIDLIENVDIEEVQYYWDHFSLEERIVDQWATKANYFCAENYSDGSKFFKAILGYRRKEIHFE